MKRTVRQWLRGLVSASVNGCASGTVLVIAEPEHFNLQDGLPKLLTTSLVLGLLGMANYLKQAPVPEEDSDLGSVPPRAS